MVITRKSALGQHKPLPRTVLPPGEQNGLRTSVCDPDFDSESIINHILFRKMHCKKEQQNQTKQAAKKTGIITVIISY